MLKALDDTIGDITKALREAKMLENTAIIFMSDVRPPLVGKASNH